MMCIKGKLKSISGQYIVFHCKSLFNLVYVFFLMCIIKCFNGNMSKQRENKWRKRGGSEEQGRRKEKRREKIEYYSKCVKDIRSTQY